MSKVSAFHVGLGAETDTTDILELVRQYLWFRPHVIGSTHSARYVRQILSGERAMSLEFFLMVLRAVQRVGRSDGREWVRRVLDRLARPFGLTVVPLDERPVGNVREEIVEANEACSRAFVTVHDAISDSLITAEEKALVQQRITAAKKELDDLTLAVSR